MTSFVESCAKTVTGSAAALARRSRGHPKAKHLLRALAEKKKILITSHAHPDPDALASSLALCTLLTQQLAAGTSVTVSFKGGIGGGLNEAFARQTELKAAPWDEAALASYDAIILVDTQPAFSNNPLPENVMPMAVIDHHRGRGKRPKCTFCDIRPDVGAVSSIIFSYFMELEHRITPDLGATLLYAIESDLAGAAGAPGELDNIALSSLTLMADTRKLYKMRYLDLPQNFFISYAQGLANATCYDDALVSHLETIPSPERTAVIADFLLRYDQARWALVTGAIGNTLLISLRTYAAEKMSAAELLRKLVRGIGEGGGHRTKAGGVIRLKEGTTAEIDRYRTMLRQRYLRHLGIKGARAMRLIPRPDGNPPTAAAKPANAAASESTAAVVSRKRNAVAG